MSESGIFTGKTVDTAIEAGLISLGLTKDEVTIEVLEEGRKGILKMGAKDAKVRIISKNDTAGKREENNDTFEHMNKKAKKQGGIWVENGEIHCVDPEDGELTVHIPPMVLLYKNNELVKEQTTITEKDELKVEFQLEQVETQWSIEQSKDKIEAVLKVEPGYTLLYTLQDQKPSKDITLKAIETNVPNLTLSIEDVHEKLDGLGIVFGIQEGEIRKACHAEEKAEFVIAKGDRPVEGKNGWLEYKVEMNEGKNFKEKKDGSIDYREGREIPSVEEGVDIALIHDPIEGTAGRAITGEEIPPKPVFPLQVKLGKGAAYREDADNVIISTSIGRPSVEKRGTTVMVDVVSKFEHQGDVNLASGNLKFNGDIMISGSVEENMSISATGNIEIRGTTSQAKVKAGQSVFLHRNVISSEIVAGNSNKIIVEKISQLNEILDELMTMQKDLKQICHNPSYSQKIIKDGLMPLLKLLIQTKFPSLNKKIRQFIIAVKSDLEMLNLEWQKMIKRLHMIFIMMDPNEIRTFEDFDQLVETIQHLIEMSNIPPEFGNIVELPSAMNSNIYSSGDVTIHKQGCYNSIIYAQGLLVVRGFIRGGRVFAGKGAEIDEVGSKAGTSTLIIVPHDQQIKIKNALADTIIQIGKKRYTFTKDISNVVARIDQNGTIALH